MPETDTAKERLSQYALARKSYILSTRKRFTYVKGYLVKKKLLEKEENPIAKALKPFLSRFTGKKGQQ